MRSIDIHAHLMPHCTLQALYRGENWHGVTGKLDAQGQMVYGLGGRRQALSPRFTWNTAQRLGDMDSLGVDVHVVSTFIGYYQFASDDQAIAACREANDEVWQMTRDYPNRFAGLCTLPMQNLRAAIDELERGITQLGLKGAMIEDTVNGRTFDAPELLPFWQAAEQLGALIFVHQSGPTLVSHRTEGGNLMRALALQEPGGPLMLAEAPLLQPGPTEVLVRVRAVELVTQG